MYLQLGLPGLCKKMSKCHFPVLKKERERGREREMILMILIFDCIRKVEPCNMHSGNKKQLYVGSVERV